MESIARLVQEQANVLEALQFCLTEPEEADAGLQIAISLYPFWSTRVLLSEVRGTVTVPGESVSPGGSSTARRLRCDSA